MAITSLDGLIAGLLPPSEFLKVGAGAQVVGRAYTPNYAAGNPPAMAAPAVGVLGKGLLTYPGCLDWPGNSGNTYLARFAGECVNPGTLLLCDRLWHNGGNEPSFYSYTNTAVYLQDIPVGNPTQIFAGGHGQAPGTFVVTIYGSTTIPSVDGTWLATYVDQSHFTIPVDVIQSGYATYGMIGIPSGRDRNGTEVGSSGSPADYGIGVQLAYEVSSVMDVNSTTLQVGYINTTGDLHSTYYITPAVSAIAGAFIPFPLADGDEGIRSVCYYYKSGSQASGFFHLVMYRVLASIGLPGAGMGKELDGIQLGLPRLYDNSCLFLVWIPGTTAAPTQLLGRVMMAQGSTMAVTGKGDSPLRSGWPGNASALLPKQSYTEGGPVVWGDWLGLNGELAPIELSCDLAVAIGLDGEVTVCRELDGDLTLVVGLEGELTLISLLELDGDLTLVVGLEGELAPIELACDFTVAIGLEGEVAVSEAARELDGDLTLGISLEGELAPIELFCDFALGIGLEGELQVTGIATDLDGELGLTVGLSGTLVLGNVGQVGVTSASEWVITGQVGVTLVSEWVIEGSGQVGVTSVSEWVIADQIGVTSASEWECNGHNAVGWSPTSMWVFPTMVGRTTTSQWHLRLPNVGATGDSDWSILASSPFGVTNTSTWHVYNVARISRSATYAIERRAEDVRTVCEMNMHNWNDGVHTFLLPGSTLPKHDPQFDEVRSYTGNIRQVDVKERLVTGVIPLMVVGDSPANLDNRLVSIANDCIAGGTLIWQDGGDTLGTLMTFTVGISPAPDIIRDYLFRKKDIAKIEVSLNIAPWW